MPSAFPLPEGWGEAWLVPAHREETLPARATFPPAGHRPPATAWSYDHRGTMLVWRPGAAGDGAAGIACDLEHVARFSGAVDPGAVDCRLRIEPWVVTEVLAKLTRTPVLAFLRRVGLVTIAGGATASVSLDALGLADVARVRLAASADGQHVAAFGVLDPPEPRLREGRDAGAR